MNNNIRGTSDWHLARTRARARGRGWRVINPHTKKNWPAVSAAAVVVHGREAVSVPQ